MKKLITIIAVGMTLISCNKEDLKPSCNCQATYEKELFGVWYMVSEEFSSSQLVIDTLLDCGLDGQVTELEEFNYTRRETITCQ